MVVQLSPSAGLVIVFFWDSKHHICLRYFPDLFLFFSASLIWQCRIHRKSGCQPLNGILRDWHHQLWGTVCSEGFPNRFGFSQVLKNTQDLGSSDQVDGALAVFQLSKGLAVFWVLISTDVITIEARVEDESRMEAMIRELSRRPQPPQVK